jgi:lipopolysaccharide transport system permease protein
VGRDLILMHDSEVIYLPDNAIRSGFIPLFKKMAGDLLSNHWLIWQIFRRDISAMYKQSFLGIFWAILLPLISVGTFIILNRAGLFSFGDILIPYPLFAVTGIILWQIFSQGLLGSTNSLVNAGVLLNKVNFPREVLIVSAIGQAMVSSLIQTCLLGILFLHYHIAPSWIALLVPLSLVPLILFTTGLGFILSVLNAVIRDVGAIFSYLMMFLLFITPVLYGRPTEGFLVVLNTYNPLYYLISGPRNLLFFGTIGDGFGFFVTSIAALILFLLSWIVFHLAGVRITERV